MNRTSRAKGIAHVLLVTVATLLVVDLVAYWAIPASLVRFAPQYRQSVVPRNPDQPLPAYAREYPRGYFRADDTLGFDIRENVKDAALVFYDATVEIFSNDLGCFDRHDSVAFRDAAEFDYFAGDSFTWGYAAWESKFPTVYERSASRLALKCGVTHTGQLHQYDKFKKIVARLGKYPRRVFVGYCDNDPANDYAHPHTTVIDGFQVDTVEVESDLTIAKRDLGQVQAAISRWLQSPASKAPARSHSDLEERSGRFFARYSLTANLLGFGKDEIAKRFASLRKGHAALQPLSGRDAQAQYEMPDPSRSLYRVMAHVSFDEKYATNNLTQRNREAIERWARDAKQHGYQLTFVLIPPKTDFDNVEFFRGLRTYLKERDIGHVDLSAAFRESKRPVASLYWHHDAHLSNEGNQWVGEWLARRFK